MPSPPPVSLLPLTPHERGAFLEAEALRYAEAKSRAGLWKREEALALAREEIGRTVGEDPEDRGHSFYKGLNSAGRTIGWVWVGPVPGEAPDPRARWLFQILVEEDLRGRGFGRALLRATEETVRRAGGESFRLNVWSGNEVARSLYESEGFEVFARYPSGQEMRKDLRRA